MSDTNQTTTTTVTPAEGGANDSVQPVSDPQPTPEKDTNSIEGADKQAPTEQKDEKKAQTDKPAPSNDKKVKTLLDDTASDDEKRDPLDMVIKTWDSSKVVVPEGMEVSKDALESFGETAIKAGLTQRQANALVAWQLEEIKAQQQALYEVGKEELQKEWGRKFNTNTKAVVSLISKIDRALGDDSFSKSLNASGAALHPGVIRGLHKIAQLISEDSLGKSDGATPPQVENALQGIENSLREQLASRRKEIG